MCTAVNSRLPQGSFPLHFPRWLFNENLRLAERFLEFDVLALQNIVSSASSHSISELQSFTRLSEGGYNRVFEATFSDVPEHHTVASEEGTLGYLRLHGLRTPEVYAWCSTKANPIGAEYIIMEKLDGTPLGNKWFSLGPKEQYKIMTQIVEWETRLMSLNFPASGSLYYSDLPSGRRTKLDDLDGMAFCVGPIAHYSWWHGERGIMDVDRGPWPSSVDIFRAVGERELTWAKAYAKPRLPYERLYREIFKTKRVSPGTHVTDLVNYLEMPNVPYDYEFLTPSEQNSVKEIHRRRVIHFLYAALTNRLNQCHYDAIFDYAGTPWEGDSVSLRAELIRSISNWSAVVESTHVAPPVDYPEDVVRETVGLDAQQREADVAMEQVRHALGIDNMGWVPNEDYEAARRLASEIKSKMLEAAETRDEVVAIRDHFPFDDFDEGA
ncbi:hypothetical protein BO83DRAFT_393201 [Aspergillus eucalypticola CBS 122712]|uniref:Phosphotransferase family protein n=1 Tax=Aspergillus eucalypticola (strain CBS 122712 / IBT 29274) TaxID=1448314 RepID=A0A317UQJ9_ASPEC|nr:uncharacterized protein BO83DRAFT_393201 [Aspergillus eucalypticola CBS 122712]PWY63639.1 hypothetical protein BO83DRAFT_393201 [Aspergillus eucalypticola CBS 122712]